jgi:hypothetical protein
VVTKFRRQILRLSFGRVDFLQKQNIWILMGDDMFNRNLSLLPWTKVMPNIPGHQPHR